ncbi:MAG TPA: hypothetical protein VHA82_11070 [Ramlibacter sp.]|uniref:hypothetical protein n=1 Tax=Ramlibacter sp. TaxID=1917967 RepID=UPI002CD4B0F3|nr:hypothetical protein [Ramlibacter sp.]HVZ44341.1 hypothetical protein [Ramlibacter sp.]
MGRSLRSAAMLAFLVACAAFAQLPGAEEFDTSAGNLLAVLRASPGASQADDTLKPIGIVHATLPDGRDVQIAASWFHYLGDTHVRLVFDGEHSMQSAGPDDLERLHLDPEQALAQAVANMRRKYGAPQVRPLGAGVMQVDAGEPDLASSYILDRAFWLQELSEHPEGLVVSIPRRGSLLFAPAGDPSALIGLSFSATAIYMQNERSRISSALYLFKDGRWSVYQPPQHLASDDG